MQFNAINAQGRQVQVHKGTDAEFETARQGARAVEIDRNAIQKMHLDSLQLSGRQVEVHKGTEEEFRKASEGHRTVQIDKSQVHRGFNAVG
jgi:hypothetical protein